MQSRIVRKYILTSKLPMSIKSLFFKESYWFHLYVVPFDVHFHYIDNAFMCTAAQSELNEARIWYTHTHTHTLPPYKQPSSRPTLRGDASAAERIHKLKKRAARVITESPYRAQHSSNSFAGCRYLTASNTGKRIQISEGPGSGLYVRTFRISTNGLIAKHTFKCQRWPIRTTSPDTVVPEPWTFNLMVFR